MAHSQNMKKTETPDFEKINGERIGYQLMPEANGVRFPLNHLSFDEFIPPYSNNAATHEEVYQNLENVLNLKRESQDVIVNHDKPAMLSTLASETLQREAIMNAMGLIKEHYLQNNSQE